ncbi:redox-regulated ATPase YchF [bacterium]|nr:redox-regulated ATPase YchF [bacterium]
MKIGIIGLPQVGKKILFEVLTQQKSNTPDNSRDIIPGVVRVKDPRFDKLVSMYSPKNEVPAAIDISLLPKIEKETVSRGEVFTKIADVDALCHIVRSFENESVYHVEGSINPIRDIDTINSELILNDMIFTEKRLERIDKELSRKNDITKEKDKEILLKLKAHLEKELPLRTMPLNKEEFKLILAYQFISMKPIIIVLNIGEEDIINTSLLDSVKRKYKDQQMEIIQVSAKIESEIASLPEAEQKDFLSELGIEEPAVNALTRSFYKTLGLISFFTVGKDEVREWMVRENSTAPEAAGVIHTDLQRGFIRAQVIKYEDLVSLGTEAKVKEAGKCYVKGKDYIVEDGDIIDIRFNV